MSKRKVIAIAVLDSRAIASQVEELVTLTIEKTIEEEYYIPESEKEVINLIFKEILENAGEGSTTCLAVKIPRNKRKETSDYCDSEARRRRRRRRRPSGGVV